MIIEFFLEVFENKTSYSVQVENPEGEIVKPIEPNYVPGGFEVIRRDIGRSEV